MHFRFPSVAPATCAAWLSAWVVLGCTSISPPAPPKTEGATTPTAQVSSRKLAWTPGQNWHIYDLPSKKATVFSTVGMDGRDAVLAVADSSASLLRQQVRIDPSVLHQVRFSWKVPQLIAAADMAQRDGDDSPVRVVFTFEGDRAKWSVKNAMLSELSLVLTGEELPYATLMYVWCNKRTPGSVIQNPRTDRIRKIVVESGEKNLNQWQDYERDIVADFEKAFGEKPGALIGMALMTDSDNTRSKTRAYYGPISMQALAGTLSTPR